MEDLKAGDVVALNSGSKMMTVLRVHKNNYGEIVALCAWNLEGEIKEHVFNVKALAKVQDDY